MPSRLPKVSLPVGYGDLLERLFQVRDRIYEALSRDEVVLGSLDILRIFEDDRGYRQTMSEVLLASILWIEAGKKPGEVLSECVPEIRKGMVYTVNSLVKYLRLKEHAQEGAYLNRGSLADAWIHLLVEFREVLSSDDQQWIWKIEQIPYVPGKYF